MFILEAVMPWGFFLFFQRMLWGGFNSIDVSRHPCDDKNQGDGKEPVVIGPAKAETTDK